VAAQVKASSAHWKEAVWPVLRDLLGKDQRQEEMKMKELKHRRCTYK
jgi:hypothetical protein